MNKYVGESERAVREVRKGKPYIMLYVKLSWHSHSSLLTRLPLHFQKKTSSGLSLKKKRKKAEWIFCAVSFFPAPA